MCDRIQRSAVAALAEASNASLSAVVRTALDTFLPTTDQEDVMGKSTEAVRDKLGAARQAADESHAAYLKAEDALSGLEDRERRRAERRDRKRAEVRS